MKMLEALFKETKAAREVADARLKSLQKGDLTEGERLDLNITANRLTQLDAQLGSLRKQKAELVEESRKVRMEKPEREARVASLQAEAYERQLRSGSITERIRGQTHRQTHTHTHLFVSFSSALANSLTVAELAALVTAFSAIFIAIFSAFIAASGAIAQALARFCVS
mmetsp:Transcript_16598/g.39827  ORF Transcript_16598/g.39827 Transcript_16598/m.39827 type:complete len:168 (-) Transcript_16598:343-846(-)